MTKKKEDSKVQTLDKIKEAPKYTKPVVEPYVFKATVTTYKKEKGEVTSKDKKLGGK